MKKSNIEKNSLNDLQKIKGIGKIKEDRFREADIETLDQLAAQSPDAIEALFEDMIGVTRATAENWIDQALQLLKEEETKEEKKLRTGNGLRYAVFKLKLVLDENSNIRQTEIDPISAEADPYRAAGWNPKQVIAFLETQAAGSADRIEEKESQPQAKVDQKQAKHKKSAQSNPPTISIDGISLVDFEAGKSVYMVFRSHFWQVRIDWHIEHAELLPDPAMWRLTLHLDPAGPGKEITIPGSELVSKQDGHTYGAETIGFQNVIKVDPGLFNEPLPKVYRLAVSIVGQGKNQGKLPMAYMEGQVVSICEPV